MYRIASQGSNSEGLPALTRRAALGGGALALGLGVGSGVALAAPQRAEEARNVADETVRYRTVSVGAAQVFYREAGPSDGPVVLLLHGFPTDSHQFRNLIPRLAGRYRVVAPDMPGFGLTKTPPRGQWTYSFATMADVVAGFVEALRLDRYAIYMFDYGAPVGFRLATLHPNRVTAIVSQNGNAYEEGLGAAWATAKALWKNPSAANRAAMLPGFSEAGIKEQYYTGCDASRVSPDGWGLDLLHFQQRADNDDIQTDLFYDYRNNVALYPTWQRYLRTNKPPLLAIWGRNDPWFIPPGAEAFKRDVPDAVVHFLDTGHFALETHGPEIADAMLGFLKGAAKH